MEQITLQTITDCSALFSNEKFVIAVGKHTWLFRADGSFIAKLTSIRGIRKVAFLLEQTALIDCYGTGMYYYISLEDGSILWSFPQKRRRMTTATKFTVTSDGCVIYSYFYDHKCTFILETIRPKERQFELAEVTGAMRSTRDLFIRSDGLLCAVQTEAILDNDPSDSSCSSNTWNYGILGLGIPGQQVSPFWVSRWSDRYHAIRASDGRYVLFEDLSIMDLTTGNIDRLLVGGEADILQPHNFDYWIFDPERSLLTVSYTSIRRNIVVDCEKRAVVAKYESKQYPSGYGFVGCLIENEFWSGTPDGIVRYPFPNLDQQEVNEI